MGRTQKILACAAALPVIALFACGGGGNGTGGAGGSGTGGHATGGGSVDDGGPSDGQGGGDAGDPLNVKPIYLGDITSTTYDGNTDDLLTAGLGKTGLASSMAPVIANPAAPTPAELRRLAIYTNYRALVDTAAAGGFGVLFGPNIDANGDPTLGEGKIPGVEHLAYADDGTGNINVTMMIQVPSSFDPDNACIVTATSSGSRGVYGAIGTAGEWGLKHGCAVAYTDKGTGNGVHDLTTNAVNLITGVSEDAALAKTASSFTAKLGDAERAAFNAATPNRLAVKHAHSQQNPERDWGTYTLEAIEFAFYVLNQQFGDPVGGGAMRTRKIKPENTIVIASSVSNGAGAALAAAELDTKGLIDGVAVGEPQIQLKPTAGLTVKRGNVVTSGSGKPLFDYFTFANLYQPCAALAAAASGSPGAALVPAKNATNRCASLHAKGLLQGATTQEQADEALADLLAYGWQPESTLLHASHYALATPAIAVTYANAYGRFSVKDNLCGYSFGAFDAATSAVIPLPQASLAKIFSTGNGVPPSSGITIINNLSPGGAFVDTLSLSPSTNLDDLNIDGAICLKDLMTGADSNAKAVQSGIAEVQHSGDLHGKPALIVHGRSDALIPVAHASRPYFGVNQMVEGAASRLSYIEVTNAQHFDAFIDNPALGGYDSQLVPLHRYFLEAMDLMYAHLKGGAALPPSQLVRTTPRGGSPGAAPPITKANVPPISLSPQAADRITYSNGTVTIPD